jgi:hypothetical protein
VTMGTDLWFHDGCYSYFTPYWSASFLDSQ